MKINKEDVKTLLFVIEAWEEFSDKNTNPDLYYLQTDHCHTELEIIDELYRKLKQIVGE